MDKLRIIWQTIKILQESTFTGKVLFEIVFNKGGIRAIKKFKLTDF